MKRVRSASGKAFLLSEPPKHKPFRSRTKSNTSQSQQSITKSELFARVGTNATPLPAKVLQRIAHYCDMQTLSALIKASPALAAALATPLIKRLGSRFLFHVINKDLLLLSLERYCNACIWL